MTDTRADTDGRTPEADTSADTGRKSRLSADTLRFVPPVAALGTAFVLQVAAMTDTVGGALVGQYGVWAYIGGGLLGLSVASCAEGGAAYLMDLYDKHLLAGDSVWMLRLTMLAYVGASAGVIHWWTGHRHLPEIISWVLAGMSASALYLWSRGSRWRRRDAMRNNGLIDDAMPRFSMAAKMFHPVRWINTVRLISWDPVRTPAEARVRYDEWKRSRPTRTRRSRTVATDTGQVVAAAPRVTAEPQPDTTADTVKPTVQPRQRTVRPPVPADTDNVVNMSGRRRLDGPTVNELADTLSRFHDGQTVGRKAAADTLKQVYGSCSTGRAIAAKDIHNARLNGHRESSDEPERELVGATA